MDYLYDGTFNGYLTALFYAYTDKEHPSIYKVTAYHPTLFTESKVIPYEKDKSERVYNSIINKLSYKTFDNLYLCYLSEIPEAETLGLNYIKLCYTYGDSINLAKNNDLIRKVDLTCQRVWREVHRFYGFVRFKEIHSMVFYATIEPDFNILPLLMGHFKARFSDQYFIIHDPKRKCAIIYNKKEIFLQYLSEEESLKLSRASIKDPFENLFKSYFESTTIKERSNPKQQRAYLPKRYHKHLVEL